VLPGHVPTSVGFSELGVPGALVATLARLGIDDPFPIQTATLPDSLAGRDVLGRGRTGSGKTLAFSLPLVTRLKGGARRPKQARSLVLVPTRELANQVLAVVAPLADAVGLTSTVVFGGVGQNPQVKALAPGIDVLIACPGRLEDLIGQGFCDLSGVEVTVLDEADHMADLGFLPVVKRLLDRTPKQGQRMLFSATLDNGVDVLVKRYLSSPVTHSVDPAVAPVSTMTHHVFSVSAADKPAVVRELAQGHDRSLLFMRTKHTAKKLAKQLTASGIPAVELHGNLSQGARERNLSAFTDGSTRVLVATDIAARGIHVDDVSLVVHVDPPTEHKAYLHRSGRPPARAPAAPSSPSRCPSRRARCARSPARPASGRPCRASGRAMPPSPRSPVRRPVRGAAARGTGAAAALARPRDAGGRTARRRRRSSSGREQWKWRGRPQRWRRGRGRRTQAPAPPAPGRARRPRGQAPATRRAR
jgi:superfamily II DNA/RNA helicase